MGEGQMMSELYQENMKRQNKNRRWKDGLAFLCILLGSLIVAVNMNTCLLYTSPSPRDA